IVVSDCAAKPSPQGMYAAIVIGPVVRRATVSEADRPVGETRLASEIFPAEKIWPRWKALTNWRSPLRVDSVGANFFCSHQFCAPPARVRRRQSVSRLSRRPHNRG